MRLYCRNFVWNATVVTLNAPGVILRCTEGVHVLPHGDLEWPVKFFYRDLTSTQVPNKDIEHIKSISSLFQKVFEDYGLYYAHSILNLESTFIVLLKLLKSIWFKRKIRFTSLPMLPKFSTQRTPQSRKRTKNIYFHVVTLPKNCTLHNLSWVLKVF